jgi:ribosomal protein S18 acetylase RimI-like enzyme
MDSYKIKNMSKAVQLRTATLDDLPTLQRFEQGIVSAERPFDHTLKPDPISYYDVGALISDTDAEVVVAEIDDVLVGSGYVKKKRSRAYVQPDYHAFIGFLYVDPNYRGRGVNRVVLDALFQWARENDLPEVHLTVYPENASAIRAYEKAGFKPYISEMRINLDE